MISARAFSSEVDTGSRQENASKQKASLRSDSIGTEKALEQRSRETDVGSQSIDTIKLNFKGQKPSKRWCIRGQL
jgi:hypothetical protein